MSKILDKLFYRGITPSMFILGVMMLIIIGIILNVMLNTPKLKKQCELNYPNYDIDFCVKNYEGIQICEKLNATLIRAEQHLFSSTNYICKKGDVIIKI